MKITALCIICTFMISGCVSAAIAATGAVVGGTVGATSAVVGGAVDVVTTSDEEQLKKDVREMQRERNRK